MIISSELVWMIVYACYLAAQLAACAHILLAKHEEPTSALLWLVLVTLLPVFGICCYLLFGINRIKAVSLNVRTIRERVERSKEKYLGASVDNYLECFKEFQLSDEAAERQPDRTLDRLLPGCVALTGNRIELLKDGVMAYPRMLEDIANARQSIRLQSFIIMNDPVGKEIFDALAAKAKQGVDVKVLYDGLGSCKAFFSSFFLLYSRKRIPNLKIHAFSPLSILAPWRIQLRNHRKLLVIDGKTAFVGGINIAQENARFKKVPRRKYIHDLHVRIAGPAVAALHFSFLKDWVYATRRDFFDISSIEDFPPPQKQGDAAVRVVDSGPGVRNGSQNVFFAASALAQKSIRIITPYFVPDPAFIKALAITAARGVEVKIIVPRNNNHVLVALATQSLYRTLLSQGVRVYEKRGLFSHVKAMLVDDQWCFMGSSNCDVRSFRLNYELDFCAEKSDFIEILRRQFRAELSGSQEIFLKDVANKKLSLQLVENLCALLAPIL